VSELPEPLRLAVERAVAGLPGGRLAAASETLSQRYRADTGSAPRIRSADDVAAYAAVRMPATFAAVESALREVCDRLTGWVPRTLLDVGAGPGGAAWAAAGVWPSLERVALVERDPRLVALGRTLAAAGPPVLRDAGWAAADLVAFEPDPADLGVASYVLGELDAADAGAVLERMASACDLVVVVEPGTPRGYEVVMRARDALLAAGRPVVAPCPHDRPCPMRGSDWCHFGARLARSAEHRRAKGAAVGHEDEPYSYVAAGGGGGTPIRGRVVRRPRYRKGLVSLSLCAPEGLRRDDVGRSRGVEYREARKAAWGTALPDPEDPGDRGDPGEGAAPPP